GQLVDHGGVVFNHLFRGALLTRDGGFDRGAVRQQFVFGHHLNTPVIVFIQHTTEAKVIPPSEELCYVFRSPLSWVMENVSRLSADYAGKTLLQLGFHRLKCVESKAYSDVRRRSTTVPLLKKRRTMTGITAAKSSYTSAIINAGTKVKCSVKNHIEGEFKTLFRTVRRSEERRVGKEGRWRCWADT